jgi:phosphoribosylformylglycinamidine synthase
MAKEMVNKMIKALVLCGDGINCEMETAKAFENAGVHCDIKKINEFIGKEKELHDYHVLALPGGFSFGDDLGSGKIFSLKIKEIFKDELNEFIANKKPVIGICNGFQVLTTLGIFNTEKYSVALEHNECGHFINYWEYVNIKSNHCIWTKGLKRLRLPIRHGEGRFVFSKTHEQTIDSQYEGLGNDNNIVMTYENNPNGSTGNIAGICDKSGYVFGLMPHPEAATHLWQYPGHSIDQGESLGQEIFNNVSSYLKENFS